MKTRIVILLCLALAGALAAAPRYKGWRTYRMYEGSNVGHGFNDIYPLVEGGFAMCGMAVPEWGNAQYWIVRTDRGGAPLASFTRARPGQDSWANTIIENDDGNLLVGGRTNGAFTAGLFGPRGMEYWFNRYGQSHGSCNAVLELKGGGYILAGRGDNGLLSDGYVVRVNENGEAIWDEYYGFPDRDEEFVAMKEIQDQGVILTGRRYGANNAEIWVMKISYEGLVIWESFTNTNEYEHASDMLTIRTFGQVTNIAVAGSVDQIVGHDNSDTKFFYQLIDLNGHFQGNPLIFDFVQGLRLDHCRSICEGPGGGFALSGYRDGGGYNCPTEVARVTDSGVLMWNKMDNFDGRPSYFNGAVFGRDNFIAFCGGLGSSDGLWAQVYKESNPPEIIKRTPSDPELFVLQGDTVHFKVSVFDPEDKHIYYNWTVRGGQVSRDSTAVIDFPNIGIDTVKVVVRANRDSVDTKWLVHVKEFYISDWTPDSLNLVVKRAKVVQFGIHTRQAAAQQQPVTYTWLVDGVALGDHADFPHAFEIPGFALVEGVAQRGEQGNVQYDAIVWNVEVRSLIGWWEPFTRSASVPRDTAITFTIWPYDPEGQSLQYYWMLNRHRVGLDSSVTVTFSNPGPQQLVASVYVGRDVEQIIWNLNVFDRYLGADTDQALLPHEPKLDAPFPNPFNSTASIRFALSHAGQTRLLVYDLQGRVVAKLTDGYYDAGYHQLDFNASGLPAGMYLLRLQSAGVNLLQKAIVAK
jgi:hypothetical protein